MSEAEFTIGAQVSCQDGVCGQLRRVVFDPIKRVLTHLVVEPKHRQNMGHLVPIDLGGMGVGGMGAGPQVVTYDKVPTGEVEVRRGQRVHASDGPIGRIRGLVVDPSDHQVTHVLLDEGHLWGKKEVSIPISSVVNVDDGVRLSLTKSEVGDLPPVDIEQHT